MLTRLKIQNFKQFDQVDLELGRAVVLIGPNNSGKTTVLQALALWHVGLLRWRDVPSAHLSPEEAVLLNRLDLTALPTPNTSALWRNLHVSNGDGTPIDITVEGVSRSTPWVHSHTFGFVNSESIACRRGSQQNSAFYDDQPPRLAFLPPMSGLIAQEDRFESGSINRRIGEGRTAEVLRNLCYQVYEANDQQGRWDQLTVLIRESFRVELLPPEYLAGRGEIRMAYRERGVTLDIASAGRGLHQTLLLLVYMLLHPGAVLLLDEPDAHLEILRQREIYHLLTTVAREQGSQLIMASHSEVLLDEAADRDTVIAFVGHPHRMDRRSKSQVAKALKEIRAVDYALAEQTGWVLYLEGATDLAILRAFAATLKHAASQYLERPFVYYLETNKPRAASDHFSGLREAKANLVGLALFDRIAPGKLQNQPQLVEMVWARREIENYLMTPETLLAYAEHEAPEHRATMQQAINDHVPPVALRDRTYSFWINTKASDDFLERVFEQYYQRLNLPNLMRKTNYHILAQFVPPEQIDPEIVEKLDAIVEVARRAQPRVD